MARRNAGCPPTRRGLLVVLLGTARATTNCSVGDPLACSLNGVCDAGTCACDAPWGGAACETLRFAPGKETACGKLCAYHGHGNDTTSWGGSVVEANGTYYMFVAEMTRGCDLGAWRTNSQVVLAASDDPLGPFDYVMDVVAPWAHNPQVVAAPDGDGGLVYALYALGDGVPLAPERDCGGRRRAAAAGAPRNLSRANFTIHYARHPTGPWLSHVASILDWPSNWDYGAVGNWNPAPMVHPDTGRVFLMAHTSPTAFDGEAIVAADSWRGPYSVVASSTSSTWRGSVKHAEDPFLWVDARGHWHALYHALGGDPGGHAYSLDGSVWSDVAAAYGTSRPLGGGAAVGYGAERPKLLFGDDARPRTPTHLYNGGSKADAFTIASPLAAA
jgi:hypothetical protein